MSTTKRMTLPRRTQEFETVVPQSSVKKPQARVSRIAQPVRKSTKASLGPGQFGENGRSRSVERGLNGLSVGGPPSSVKKISLNPRSSSATPQLRTPLRGMYSSGLNAENIPPFVIPSTVERERCTVETRQIFDYLSHANITELPKEFIERANLKAMSMKQFIYIVAHLLRQIGGSRYKIGANYIEDITRAITELQCPFTVSKSMLKTPSAPHSIQHVTMLLTWLIQLAPPPPPTDAGELVPNYQQASEFPSAEYTQFFLQSAIDSFHLWNLKREEEFGAQVEAMVDRLVADRTGGLTQEQLRARIEHIRAQLEAIGSDLRNGQPREQSFDGVQHEVLEKQRVEKQLTDELKQLSKVLEKAEHEYYQRQDQYYDCENAIRKVKEQLSHQQITVKQREELQALIVHNKNLIGAKRRAIVCLEDELSDYQIALARLIKQNINLTSELNTKMYNFSNALKPDIHFNPIELSLTTSNYPELQQTLQALNQQLADLFQQYHELCVRLNREKFQLEQVISDLQLTIAPLETKIAKQKERLQQLQQQRETIGRELAALEEKAHEHETRKDRGKELDQLIEQVREQLVSNQKGIEKLAHDKQQLMEDGLERCRQALEERHRKLDGLRTYVEGCETIMQQIEDSYSRRKEKEKENEDNCP